MGTSAPSRSFFRRFLLCHPSVITPSPSVRTPFVIAGDKMNENNDRADIEARYEALKEEHRALDHEITGGDLGPIRDQLALSEFLP